MTELLLPRYLDDIARLDLDAVSTPARIPSRFVLAREGRYSVHYIPFEHVNTRARLVVVGIAPGFVQWKNAMREAQRQLAAGASHGELLRAARLSGAFSGAIRPNFIALLDAIGMERWLGIASCATLFDLDADLVHIGAILRHPVFDGDRNYSGSPGMAKVPFLRGQVLRYFGEEAAALPDALYIPMGASVAEGLEWLAREGVIRRERILHGLPHPSGANAERVAYFLGRKERGALSGKTNADQLDAARGRLLAQMADLLAIQAGTDQR